uniref:Uncharacterized protein n=1 Tax=Rhizophora mucronata TaxID=61149 RepID=A0A2P2QQE9_RHIMU
MPERDTLLRYRSTNNKATVNVCLTQNNPSVAANYSRVCTLCIVLSIKHCQSYS